MHNRRYWSFGMVGGTTFRFFKDKVGKFTDTIYVNRNIKIKLTMLKLYYLCSNPFNWRIKV